MHAKMIDFKGEGVSTSFKKIWLHNSFHSLRPYNDSVVPLQLAMGPLPFEEMYQYIIVVIDMHPEIFSLTHWGRDKMAAVFQTTFSNAFSRIKCMNFD